MKATIIVFLWIVGALCLFIIAFLTYDLIVHAQDRKAQRQASANSAPAEPPTDKPEPAPSSSPSRKKPN